MRLRLPCLICTFNKYVLNFYYMLYTTSFLRMFIAPLGLWPTEWVTESSGEKGFCLSCFVMTECLYFCTCGLACLLKVKITISTTFKNFLGSKLFHCCWLDMLNLLHVNWTTVFSDRQYFPESFCLVILIALFLSESSHCFLKHNTTKKFQWTLGSTYILRFGNGSENDSS